MDFLVNLTRVTKVRADLLQPKTHNPLLWSPMKIGRERGKGRGLDGDELGDVSIAIV